MKISESLKKKLDETLKASYRIKNLHIRLKNLEKNGLANSKDFFMILDYLDMATESFNEIFNKQYFSYFELSEAYKFLFFDHFQSTLFDYEELLDPKKFKDGYTLVYALIGNCFKKGSDKEIRLTPLDTKQIEGVTKDNVFIEKDLERDYETHKLINNDLVLTIILFIDDYLKKNPNHRFKDDLLMAKYHLGFINPVIGKKLKNQNFSLDAPLIIGNLDFEIDISKIKDPSAIYYFRKYFLERLISKTINALSDQDYTDMPEENYDVIIRKIIIISSIINLDLTSFNIYKKQYEEMKHFSKQKYPNAILIEGAIDEAINLYSSEYFVRFKSKEADEKIFLLRGEKQNGKTE